MPETVFASVILAAGLSIFLTAFSFSAKCIFDARNQMLAMNYARETVENRRIYNFRDPNLALGTYTVTSDLYRATLAISSRSTKEKQLVSTVVWTNYTLKAARTTEYFTVISDSVH